MKQLVGENHLFNIKHETSEEMTKNEKAKRSNFTTKEIELELKFLEGNLICDKELTLKIGAQVMSIINITNDCNQLIICNGSQGIVTEFCKITGCTYVLFNNGKKLIMTRHTWESERIPGIGVSQVPLILAWALTIHKSQGSTLDAAEIDVGSGIFECGQTYVALSRIQSLDGLYLCAFNPQKIRINKKVQDFYNKIPQYDYE